MRHGRHLRNARVLVTGASGLVGRHCLPLLREQGAEVHAVTSRPATDADGVRWHQADLLDHRAVGELVAHVRPQCLLHLAWLTAPGEYRTSPQNTRWAEASLELVRQFAACGGGRTVIAGTCLEYGPSETTCREEATPLAPTTPYGRAKLDLWQAVEELAHREELSVAWGRIFYLYGPHEDPRRFVASVVRSVLAGRRGAVLERRAGARLSARGRRGGGARATARCRRARRGQYRVGPDGGGQASGAGDWPLVVAAGIGTAGSVPAAAGEPPVLAADVTRLRHEVEWRPAFDLRRGLQHTIDWWRRLRRFLMSHNTSCPVCSARATAEFLRRDGVSVHQHSLMASRQAARSIGRGSLAMHVCGECGFVFNADFDPALLDYGPGYDNTQTFSAAFDSYVDELVAHMLDDCDVRGARIVEVGCGQGTFLRKLVADAAIGNEAVGFDPSYRGPERCLAGRLRYVNEFFGQSELGFQPNVVVCRHVIEHVERPVEFLRSISAALAAAGTKHAARIFRNALHRLDFAQRRDLGFLLRALLAVQPAPAWPGRFAVRGSTCRA